MPLPVAARDYLLKALDGVPDVASALLGSLNPSDPVWDRRLDPERFTLREILAHLADWEPIWLERLQKIAEAGHPFLPSIDEGALAVSNDYASSDPQASLRRYREGRTRLIEYLSGVGDDSWDLPGDREFVGVLTMQQLAVLALSHDGYHLRQIVQWMA